MGAIPPELFDEWLHPPSLKAATGVQRAMAERVITEDDLGEVRTLGGADISCKGRDPERIVHAALVALDAATLQPVDTAGVTEQARFPYVSGYLAFRESPPLVKAFAAVGRRPDLIFVDGQGISHPRGIGSASHLGVLLDQPTIGIAKTVLCGEPAGELGPEAGDRTPLVWKGRTIGAVLRSRRGAKPIYVSVGHRVSLETAVAWTLKALAGRRLPEPIRAAHDSANALRRAYSAG